MQHKDTLLPIFNILLFLLFGFIGIMIFLSFIIPDAVNNKDIRTQNQKNSYELSENQKELLKNQGDGKIISIKKDGTFEVLTDIQFTPAEPQPELQPTIKKVPLDYNQNEDISAVYKNQDF
jgi:hypothetical protein